MRDIAPRAVLQPPELSLLTAARSATGGPVRWEDGLKFPTAVCGQVRLYDPCTGEILELLDRAPAVQPDYDPFVIQTWFECSTGTSNTVDDIVAQASQQLEAFTPYAVEHELWTGTLSRQAAGPNRSFVVTDDDITDRDLVRAEDLTPSGKETTGVSPLYAIGALEQALGSFPGRSYLHGSLQASAFLATQASLDPSGNRLLRTKNGAVIVGAAGYPGTGPDGTDAPDGTTWVYGTGPVTVRLSAPDVPDEGLTDLDRETNTLLVRAERLAAATWDGCALFAILMTLKSD